MQKLSRSISLALALPLLAGACLAQDANRSEQQKFYRLDFVVKEVDAGKTVNSRSYFLTVATPAKQKSEIRTGNKVPFETSAGNWTQIDIGTSFDCFSAQEVPAGLSLVVVAEVSSILENSMGGPTHPILRQNRWNSTVIVPFRKPTVIFSSDDMDSKRQMQVELAATPIT